MSYHVQIKKKTVWLMLCQPNTLANVFSSLASPTVLCCRMNAAISTTFS